MHIDPLDSWFNVRPGPDAKDVGRMAGPVWGPQVWGPPGISAGFRPLVCTWGNDLGAFLQHTPASVSGAGDASASGAGMYSGGMSTGQFMTMARSVLNAELDALQGPCKRILDHVVRAAMPHGQPSLVKLVCDVEIADVQVMRAFA